MSEEHELYDRINKANDIVDIGAALLWYCREKTELYYDATSGYKYYAGLEKLKTLAREKLSHIRVENLEKEDRVPVISLLDSNRKVPLVIRARAVALGLNDAIGRRFFRVFKRRSQALPGTDYTVQPDDPVPAPTVDLLSVIRNPNTLPENLYDRPDRLRYLRLCPRDITPFDVDLVFKITEEAAPLFDFGQGEMALATAALNDTIDEFHWDEYRRDGINLFGNVRPKEEKQQVKRITAVLKAAVKNISILIYPELFSDSAGVRVLHNEFRKLRAGEGPVLLVAGSYHAGDQNSGYRNISETFIRGFGTPLVHNKFAPFRYSRDGKDYNEDIPTKHRLKIYYTDGWSFTVLICRDFLNKKALDILEGLGVNLVLVPALTFKDDAFRDLAGTLRAYNQAFVVLANNPIRPSRTSAIFAVPRQGGGTVPICPDEAPAICVYHASGEKPHFTAIFQQS